MLMAFVFLFQINHVIDRINLDIRPKKRLIRIKDDEFRILKDYILIMEPIATALNILQGDKNASLGYVLPALYTIKNDINRIQLFTEHRNALRQKLMECFDRRFFDIMDINIVNKEMIVAAISHPKFKLSWLPEADLYRAETIFIDECLALASSIPLQHRIVHEEHEEDQNCFFVVFNRRDRRNSDEVGLIRIESMNYLDNSSRRIDILNSYHTVKELFIKFNTTLASSAPVERLFSKCLEIFAPRRTLIDTSNFERTLLLEQNSHLQY